MLVSGCDWMNQKEKSPVSFVLFELSIKHFDLKAIRNYSPAFFDGIVRNALTKDNVTKHKKSTCTARL